MKLLSNGSKFHKKFKMLKIFKFLVDCVQILEKNEKKIS